MYSQKYGGRYHSPMSELVVLVANLHMQHLDAMPGFSALEGPFDGEDHCLIFVYEEALCFDLTDSDLVSESILIK